MGSSQQLGGCLGLKPPFFLRGKDIFGGTDVGGLDQTNLGPFFVEGCGRILDFQTKQF